MPKMCVEMLKALELAKGGMSAYAIEKKFKEDGIRLSRAAICKRPEYKAIMEELNNKEWKERKK